MDVTLGGILDRSGEDLARWEIALAVGIDPGPAGDTEAQVRTRRGDVDLAALLEPGDHAGLPRRKLAPGSDRIGPVEHTGHLQERGELVGRHLGVLGVSGGREDRGRPAVFTPCGALEGALS